MAGPRPALVRRARRLLGYWRSETRTLRQGLVALVIRLLARFAGALFGQPSISLWDLAVISIVGGAIGSVLVLTITIGLSALSYRLEWDLDSVSTPMVTALGDMTTLPSLFLATFLVRNE